MRRISLSDIASILDKACINQESREFDTIEALSILGVLGLLNEERVEFFRGPKAPDFIEPYQKEALK